MSLNYPRLMPAQPGQDSSLQFCLGDAVRRQSVVFIYLGRRGALGQFTIELAQAAQDLPLDQLRFVISSSVEASENFDGPGMDVCKIPTFVRATPTSLVFGYWRARQMLRSYLMRIKPDAVVTLMPHVWSPLIAPTIKRMGIRYITVVHDASAHPGDSTAGLTQWLLRDVKHADLVVTLSRSVADALVSHRIVGSESILPLFHPDLCYGKVRERRPFERNRALRILFFGRIMEYKGLPLLIDAVERVRAAGLKVELGVAGAGDLSGHLQRLHRLGANITNRWIGQNEIASLFGGYDAVVCSHTEASQSGVVAAALGSRLPIVGTPVGGIAEQVIDGRTGVLARRASAASLADAIIRLIKTPNLYENICDHISRTSEDRSMYRFLTELLNEVSVVCSGKTPSLLNIGATSDLEPSRMSEVLLDEAVHGRAVSSASV